MSSASCFIGRIDPRRIVLECAGSMLPHGSICQLHYESHGHGSATSRIDRTHEVDQNPPANRDEPDKDVGVRLHGQDEPALSIRTLIILAIAVRVAAVLVLQSHEVPRSTYEHGEIAANLLAGRGFATRFLGADGPTSQQAPVYPLLVALAYGIGGVGNASSLAAPGVRTIDPGRSARLGGLAAGPAGRPGRPWLARTAALVVAVHPTLVYAATHVQVASFGAVLLVWTLVLAYQTGLRPDSGCRDHRAAGSPLLALTDPILSLACSASPGPSGSAEATSLTGFAGHLA